MAKKQKVKITTIEKLDSYVPIFCITWVLVFAYISLFNESTLMALITVMPLFFIYGLYSIFSAIYVYKEMDILKELGRDTRELERRYRKQPPKLSVAKLTVGGGCILAGILLCIFL